MTCVNQLWENLSFGAPYSDTKAQLVTCHANVTRGHWTFHMKKLRHCQDLPDFTRQNQKSITSFFVRVQKRSNCDFHLKCYFSDKGHQTWSLFILPDKWYSFISFSLFFSLSPLSVFSHSLSFLPLSHLSSFFTFPFSPLPSLFNLIYCTVLLKHYIFIGPQMSDQKKGNHNMLKSVGSSEHQIDIELDPFSHMQLRIHH